MGAPPALSADRLSIMAQLSLDRSDAGLVLSGIIRGTGTLVQMGTGTSILTGADTYTGGTTISAGTLQLGNGTAIGSIVGNVIDSGVLMFNRSDAGLILSGNISGTGSVVQAGLGTSTLSGTNTYSGVTTVSAGSLQAGSLSALSANSDFTVMTGATLNLNGFSNAIGSLAGNGTVTNSGVAAATLSTGGDNATSVFSGTLQNGTGTLGLTKAGTGTLTLSGTNTYSGATTVSAGILRAGSTTGLSATSDFTVTSILDLGGFANSIGSLAGTGTVTNTGAAATLTAEGDSLSTTFSGVLQSGSGTLALTKAGTGTLTLTGTNTYTGGTTISAGTLQLGNATATGSIVGNVIDNSVLQFNRSDTALNLAGPISGTGSVIQAGTGTVTLSGTNTYSGVTTVNAGTLQAGSVTGLSATSDFTVNATLNLNGFSNDIGSLAGGGTVTNTGAAATLSAGADNVSSVFIGTLQNGPGALGLTKAGSGIFTLSGLNTYSGATTVNAGTLRAGSTTALSANSDFTVTSTLDLNGFSNAIGSLAGSGILTNNGAALATLTVGSDNASTTFSGVLQNGVGTLGLSKTGTGTLILTGTTNTYSGLSDVQGGQLSVRGNLGTSAVHVESGATLGGAGTINGAVTILSGGILAPGNSTVGTLTLGSLVLNSGSVSNFELGPAGTVGGGVNDLVAVTGNLTLAGTLNVTDAGGFGAGVYRLFNYGGILSNNGMTIGTVPGGVIPGALTIQISIANQINLVVSGASLLQFWDGPNNVETGTVSGGTGTWDTTTTNWTIANGSTNSAWKQGFAVFEGTAATVTLGANVTMAGLQFVTTGYQITTANGSTITAASGTVLEALGGITRIIGVGIVGAGDVTKTGSGTVILTAANTYTGGTTVTAGILQLGNGGNSGSVTGPIIDNGQLSLDRSDSALVLSGAISGTGTLVQMGTGTSILTGANTYSGLTTISAGTLQLGNGGVTGSIVGNVTDNGVLMFNRSDAGLTLGGNINGAGSVVQAGTGTVTLSGTNTYSGVTTVSAGTLLAGSATALSVNSAFTVNGTLDLEVFPTRSVPWPAPGR